MEERPSDGEQPPDPAGDRPGPGRPQAPAPRPSCPCSPPRSATSWSTPCRAPAATSARASASSRSRSPCTGSSTRRATRSSVDTGHQAYVHKILTGRPGRLRDAAPAGRAVGLPEPRRVRARRHREQPRLDRAVLRRRAGQGATASAARTAAVVAVVGDGALTGGMCWEALNNIAAGSTARSSSSSTTTAAPTRRRSAGSPTHLATLRMTPGYERALDDRAQARWSARRSSGRRSTTALHGVKRGVKDFLAAAGAVRGPRPEVRRPDRRPRHRRPSRRRCAGPRSSAGRSSCTRSPSRATATSRPTTTRPTACTASASSTRSPARRVGAKSAGWTSVLRRGDRSASATERPDVVGDHRRDAAAGRAAGVRRARTPTAPSTSASPSSTRSPRPPASPWAGCTRSSASTPPSSTARSTRSLMDVALHRLPVTVRARPGRRDRRGRCRATTACGTCRSCRSSPASRIAAPRDAATLREELREAVAVDRRADGRALPQGLGRRGHARARAARTGRRARRRARRRRRAARRGRRARAGSASRSPSGLRGPGHRRHRRRPALGRAGRAASSWRSRRRTAWSSRSRTAAAPAASAPSCRRRCATRGVDVPARDVGIPRRFLDHGAVAQVMAEIGLTAQDVARPSSRRWHGLEPALDAAER